MVVPVAAAAARAGVTAARSGAKKGAVAKTKGSGVQNARLVTAANDNGGYSRAARMAYRSQRGREDTSEAAFEPMDNSGYSANPSPSEGGRSRTSVPNTPAQNKVGKIARKAKLLGLSTPIWYEIGSIWLTVQLPFALLSFAAIGSEAFIEYLSRGLGNAVSPGRGIFIAGWVLTIIAGLASLTAAIATYAFRKVNPFKHGIANIALFACFIGYFIPGVNLIPWAAVWVGFVIFSHE